MFQRSRSGAHALEMALLMPVVVMFLTGTIDYGWIFFHQSALDSAASVGCRAGALVDPGDGDIYIDDVKTAAQDAMETALRQSGAGECGSACETDVEVYGTRPGRSLRCTVTRELQPLIGLYVQPITLQSGIAVRLEWQREES